MNKIRTLYIVLVAMTLASCKEHLQIFTVDSPDLILYENDFFVSETPIADFIYDFWSEGGIPIIKVVNNYSDTILLDFKKSYFVIQEDRYSFANQSKPDSILNYPPDVGFNVMYGEMPGSIFVSPDTSFTFESMIWNLILSKDVSDENLTERYLYSNSPLRMEHHFVVSYVDSNQVRNQDTITHRLYVNQVDQYDYSVYSQFVQSNILSNKFYVNSTSLDLLGYEERSSLSATILGLFLGK